MSAQTTDAKVTLRLSVLGTVQLGRAVAGRIRLVSDFTPVFHQIRDDYHDMEEAAFAQEGSYEGNPAWAPLSAKYAAWKAKRFPGARILYRTGALYKAVTGGAGHIERIAPFHLELGGSIRVGRWDLGSIHQKPKAGNPLPQRMIINLSKKRKSRWTRFFLNHLKGEGRET